MKNKLSKVLTNDDIINVCKNNKLISLALRLPCDCNLNCSYCYGKIETKGKKLNFKEIKDILKQASELEARTVEIVGEGEPILYSEFKKLIVYIDDLGMIPTLYSNCTLITLELANFLFDHNVTIIGKQNSLIPKKQDEITGINNSFHRIMLGLNNLIKVGFNDTKPSRLGIHTIILKENISEIPKMWLNWRKMNILPQVQALVYPSISQENQYFEYYKYHASTPQETRKLFEELSNLDRTQFGINWNPALAYPIAPDGCRVIYGTIGITQEGNIQICSYTEKSLGNIRDISLIDIIQSDEVKKIRDTGKILNYPNNGYGCRANAFNMTGDRYKPDPFYERFILK